MQAAWETSEFIFQVGKPCRTFGEENFPRFEITSDGRCSCLFIPINLYGNHRVAGRELQFLNQTLATRFILDVNFRRLPEVRLFGDLPLKFGKLYLGAVQRQQIETTSRLADGRAHTVI